MSSHIRDRQQFDTVRARVLAVFKKPNGNIRALALPKCTDPPQADLILELDVGTVPVALCTHPAEMHDLGCDPHYRKFLILLITPTYSDKKIRGKGEELFLMERRRRVVRP